MSDKLISYVFVCMYFAASYLKVHSTVNFSVVILDELYLYEKGRGVSLTSLNFEQSSKGHGAYSFEGNETQTEK